MRHKHQLLPFLVPKHDESPMGFQGLHAVSQPVLKGSEGLILKGLKGPVPWTDLFQVRQLPFGRARGTIQRFAHGVEHMKAGRLPTPPVLQLVESAKAEMNEQESDAQADA